CRMGCRFCASTLGGRVRDLLPSEILDQVYRIEADAGERVSHVVLMGSGEPFDNYDAVVRFLRLVSDPGGKQISLRNITVSTCGLTEGILRFAGEGLPVTLALSLHASDDETRKKLMPVANRYTLKEVLEACDTYFRKTGRRVSCEYSVVRGVNDTDKDAEKLGRLLAGRKMHVNLIPVNPVTENRFERPDPGSIAAFQKKLTACGVHATVRRELGTDIDGACGQLRAHFLNPGEGGTVS
ncbi:MAG: radical SAM protein, partial [Lachnospiraceae bacterium]|nr:radical SAM protein [Lachnospiraceae bacterium]